MEKTPEERFYDAIVYEQLNGSPKCIGRVLNTLSYEDSIHIMRRIASRVGYEVCKIEPADDDEYED